MQTVHFLGMPEGDQALAQAAIYLSLAQKSDAAYQALNRALEEVRTGVPEPVPLHLRNPVTRAMKEWGYGHGYQHAHQFDDAVTTMQCLPDALRGTRFYLPTSRGLEKRAAERLDELRRARGEEG
jgi:putative ATPase